ncbi:MAG: peptidyl-tRNA hydrolase [Deltaproteobacteria bacterium]|nr:peptidyl-tRNA hydrolase [Deltaproteobacteria bacterium]
MKLILGLGNPGRSYCWTRHNVGFLLLDCLAEKHEIEISRRGMKSLYGRGRIGPEAVILAKPQTFMNLSGEAAQRLLQFFKLKPEDTIVLHDDLDLPWGKVRIRIRGGDGGHKGIRSIIEALGNEGFVRFKIGIGRPENPFQDPADFVLEPLTGEKREECKKVIEGNAEALETLILEGPQKAMDRFHKKNDQGPLPLEH